MGTMPHDKGPYERCFFCKNCNACNGSGVISGYAQRCLPCMGRGFKHDSSMPHDKAPDEKCFFCKDCNICGGTGQAGGGGMHPAGIAQPVHPAGIAQPVHPQGGYSPAPGAVADNDCC